MMGSEGSLQETVLENGRAYMSTTKSCDDIKGNLKNIEFNIQSTKITIAPKGYLYTSDNKCFVGIEGIPDKFN